ncbi:MAG: hypothetical protein JWN44_5952 [Myxococcales bacterium]|nr:hypothetical protein [Myxococcales bacterium]
MLVGALEGIVVVDGAEGQFDDDAKVLDPTDVDGRVFGKALGPVSPGVDIAGGCAIVEL